MIPLQKISFVCLTLFCLLSAAWALTTEEIIQKALEKDDQLRHVRQVYEYDLTVITEKFNREEKTPFETQKSCAVVRPDKQISIELGDDPSNEKRVKESQKIMAVMNLKKLAPRFNLSLEKDENISGKDCHVIRFDPKPDQSYDSPEEKVINALAGKFWIDKNDFSIVRSEGRLTQPTSVAWVFATMREVHFEYEAAPLPNGDFGPARFELLYDLQASLVYRRRLQTSTMENYREIVSPSVTALR